MTSRDFCYWLQGFLEISEVSKMTPKQLQVVKNHLAMVFKREIDPSHGDKTMQEELSKLHEHGYPSSLAGILDAGKIYETKLNC